MKRTLSCVSSVIIILFSAALSAVQPLNELDLGDVSADAGVNVLNLYGMPAAGITVDTSEDVPLEGLSLTLPETKHSEGEEAVPAAEQRLSELERSLQSLIKTDGEEGSVSVAIIEKIVAATDITLREASVVDNNSSIRYRSDDFQHSTDFVDPDTISINRKLLIERLSFENLSGDNGDSGRSAGSIYISNWSSQGGARIVAD